MKSLRNRVCLVTGAASGIGRATAELLAAEGAKLCLTDINRLSLDAVAQELTEKGGQVVFYRALDVSDPYAVQAFADDIHKEHGCVDVVMNIAGISTWGTVENLELTHWNQIIEVNLLGPIHVIHAFLPPMIKAGRGGHLVNVSSAAGLFGLPWHAAYSASKFGLRGISEVLRFDLRQHGIGVSLVCPGAVNTGLVETINVVGVDRDDPDVGALTRRFQRHAKPPEHAAKKIIAGVKKNRYWVFTSLDIRLGVLAQRFCPSLYEGAMKWLSRMVHKVYKDTDNGSSR